KKYGETDNDILKHDLSLIHKNYRGKDFKAKLGQYIEQKHMETGGLEFHVQNNPGRIFEEKNECSLSVTIWNPGEWHFQVQAVQPNLVMSAIDKYDTLKSDGIHLIACTTNPYMYLSVFFFPKMVGENIKVLAFDDISKAIYPDDAFQPKFIKKDDGYLIEFLINKSYFPPIYQNNHLFCDMVMAVCNPFTQERGQSISRVKNTKRWFLPSEYIKVWQ
ncbi:MAG: hypothetical protein IJR83_07450, partial [Clostridia bacterium]|nr:hypothetical protein [Clostridia bacterium]